MHSFFQNIAQTVSKTVKNWPGFENIAKKLSGIPQVAYEHAYKAYDPQIDGFNVITHGDMFMNNLLFRYDQNGKPVDIRFVSIRIFI